MGSAVGGFLSCICSLQAVRFALAFPVQCTLPGYRVVFIVRILSETSFKFLLTGMMLGAFFVVVVVQ